MVASSDVILRRYSGPSFESALDTYEADLASMSAAGWYPVAKAWGWDPVESLGWAVGGSHWRPGRGTLAVTYLRSAPKPQTSSS